jgi:hypothetical protein
MDGFLFFDGLGLAMSGALAEMLGHRIGFLYQAAGFGLFGLLFEARGSVVFAVGCAYYTARSLRYWRGEDDDDNHGDGEGRRWRSGVPGR